MNCANCNSVLGKLEKTHAFEGQVVCGPCHARLTAPPIAGGHKPGGFMDPERNKRSASVLLRVFVWGIAALAVLGILSLLAS